MATTTKRTPRTKKVTGPQAADKPALPTLYKVLSTDGVSVHGGSMQYSLPKGKKPGDWHEVTGALIPCINGFHLTTTPALWYVPDCRVFEAEADGESVQADEPDKWCCRKVRLLREIDTNTVQIFTTGSHEVTEGKAIAVGDAKVEAWGSSNVEAWGSSKVEAWGSSKVEARDSSKVVAWDSSKVEAWDSSKVEAWDSSKVVARGSSNVEAWGSSNVEAWGSSKVVARGSSKVEAWGSSNVEARDSSKVEAWGSSKVVARDSSKVVAWDSSKVEAWDSSNVEARGSSKVEAWDNVTVVQTVWHDNGFKVALSNYAVCVDRRVTPPAIRTAWTEDAK